MTASKQNQDGTDFHPDSAWKRSSENCIKLTSAECTVKKILMMGREGARNM
jgi:hypothetical protein